MGKKIKAVIFDMGGVILRTFDPLPRQKMAERFGCSRAELEEFVFSSPTAIQSELGGLSEEEHWRVVLDHFKQSGISPREASNEFFSGDALNQELVDFIRPLRSGYLTGLLSNAWQNARAYLSQRYSFMEVFDEALFSSEAGVRKPDKKIYDLMTRQLNVQPSEAVFIDDLMVNIQGAEIAGMRAIRFETNSQVMKEVKRLLAEG